MNESRAHDRKRIHDTSHDRRTFLQGSVAAVVVGGAAVSMGDWAIAAQPFGNEEFVLPELPFAYDALVPVIDETTMTIHHTKHHQAYITNLNKALVGNDGLAGKPVEELLANLADLPESIRTTVRNNGGGHANHTLFWTVMRSPHDNNAPTGELAEALISKFGSVAMFQEAFGKLAMGQFGSGWAWLVVGDNGLEALSTPNQDSPLSNGKTPILGLDVWEHAYYLNYQNRRADYVAAWWKLVDWDQVAKNLTKAG